MKYLNNYSLLACIWLIAVNVNVNAQKMNSEIIYATNMTGTPDGSIIQTAVLPGEIEGVDIEHVSVKGNYRIEEPAITGCYDVLLSIQGEASLSLGEDAFEFNSNCIVRIPYNKPFSINIEKENEFQYLRIRKHLNDSDCRLIAQDPDAHSSLYMKAISDCPAYTEDIKSDKAVNRMILPEGLVPRFCMGSVMTEGPDAVAEHEHPMLDQLFLGLQNCRCTCYADGEQTVLIENMMLHIPLGSKHSVSVLEGDTLYYIWFDFFLTLEGQKYMEEQHHMKDDYRQDKSKRDVQ